MNITTIPAVAHVLTQAQAMTLADAEALNRAADHDEHNPTRSAAFAAALAALFRVSDNAVRAHLCTRVTEAIPLTGAHGAFWGIAKDTITAAAHAEHLTAEQWQTLTGHWTRVMGPIPNPHTPATA